MATLRKAMREGGITCNMITTWLLWGKGGCGAAVSDPAISMDSCSQSCMRDRGGGGGKVRMASRPNTSLSFRLLKNSGSDFHQPIVTDVNLPFPRPVSHLKRQL